MLFCERRMFSVEILRVSQYSFTKYAAHKADEAKK